MGKKITVFGTTAMAMVLVGVNCGGPAKEGKQGAECYRAEECAAGLVCIDAKCTSNLSSVNIIPEGGMVPPPPDDDAGTTLR
jgi:hypothetical protein